MCLKRGPSCLRGQAKEACAAADEARRRADEAEAERDDSRRDVERLEAVLEQV
jgi:predicted phage gp36 major capsid-like protein